MPQAILSAAMVEVADEKRKRAAGGGSGYDLIQYLHQSLRGFFGLRRGESTTCMACVCVPSRVRCT